MNLQILKYMEEIEERIEKELSRGSFSAIDFTKFNFPYWYSNVIRPFYSLTVEDLNAYSKNAYTSKYDFFHPQKYFSFSSTFSTYKKMKRALDKQYKEHKNLMLMSHYEFNAASQKSLRIPVKYWKENKYIISAAIVDGEFKSFMGDNIDDLIKSLNSPVSKSKKYFTEEQIDILNKSIAMDDPSYECEKNNE